MHFPAPCPKCKEQLFGPVRFCPYCGQAEPIVQELEEAAKHHEPSAAKSLPAEPPERPPTPQLEPAAPPPLPATPPTAVAKRSSLRMLLFATAALCLLGVGGYFLPNFLSTEGVQKTAPSSPLPATLALDSMPAGASVRIDGEERGTTPLSLALPPATYTLELAADNAYEVVRRQVSVVAGENVSLAITLPPKQATLSLNSIPPAAKVSVNGEERGKTPLKLSLPSGRYQISLQLPDYQASVQIVDLGPGERREISVKLVAPVGKALDELFSQPSQPKAR